MRDAAIRELGEQAELARQRAAHAVLVQREGLQAREAAEGARHCRVETIVVDIEQSEVGELAKLRRQRAGDAIIVQRELGELGQ